MERDQYGFLLQKIDSFVRRFYLSKLLRGFIYAAASILGMYLLIFSWIYFTHPGATIKTVVFFLFVAVSLALIAIWMIIPILSMLRLRRHLSTEEAAALIGSHFTAVKDKLINTLQLKQLADQDPVNSRLIMAGIEQRLTELRPIPFYTAVRMRDNRRYLKYLLFPASCILLIAFIAPAMLREGTAGLLQYDRYIPPQAPFQFNLLNKTLTVMQGDDLTLQLGLNGKVLPNEIYLQDGINRYKAEKDAPTRFSYTLRNVQQNKQVSFQGGGFSSSSFQIKVIPKPSLLGIRAMITYPSYLGRSNSKWQQAGDLEIPEGSNVHWEMTSNHADRVMFRLGADTRILPVGNRKAMFRARMLENARFTVQPVNDQHGLGDSLSHTIRVIKDQLPQIDVVEKRDSSSRHTYYFTGNAADDYGLTSLFFVYQVKRAGKVHQTFRRRLPVGGGPAHRFFHAWKFNRKYAEPGDVIEYFFEVADNDAVNGPKKARSTIAVFDIYTEAKQKAALATSSQSLKQKIKSAVGLAADVEKETRKLNQSLLDKPDISTEERKQISQLLQKQKQLDQAVQEIRDLQERNNGERDELLNQDPELKEKQQQIEDLFKNALDEKTRQMLERLQSLLDQQNKRQTTQEMSKIQLDNKTVKNELDRILELYKQLEFEQNLQSAVDGLKALSKAQRDLAGRTEKAAASKEALQKEQAELSKKLDELKKDMADLQRKNQALERPNDFAEPEKEFNGVRQAMNESSEALGKNDKGKAAGKQQQAAAQLEQLANKMEELQKQSEESENKINTAQLRKLLENLLKSSFEQEKVLTTLRRMSPTDPAYAATVQRQRSIKDNIKTVADSLYALSRRVPQIETAVNEEINKINFNIDKSLESLGERRTGEANSFQQYAMTSLNNLAVMLNEALEQLQRAQRKASSGGKGKSSGSMQQLARMQEQLNKNMQQAREQLQRSGNEGKVPKGQMTEQFARMAQQQQMIREALQKLNREKNKDGKGSLGNLNQTVEEMKKTESDLVNKRLQQETLLRQKSLLTKLLEAERAERDQEQDERRESKAGKEFPPAYQKMLDQYKKEHARTEELLEQAPPGLNSYFKVKMAEYYKLLDLRKK